MAAEAALPGWVRGGPAEFASEVRAGSKGLTDKVNGMHLFQFAYHPNLARMVRRKLARASSAAFLRLSSSCLALIISSF